MPWPKDHKRNTHERIVEAAAAAFRQEGIAEVGVAEVMRSAGLTHGGFYAHFASKDDLLAEAILHASTEVSKILEASTEDSAANQRLFKAALTYLSAAHLTHLEWGCPIAALGPELLRGSQKVRKALAAEIRRRFKELYDLTPEEMPAEARRRQVAGACACMVGGLIIARGMKESERREFLDDCHRFLREALLDPKITKK
jgi:TetR/AcrR family transcriptional repressor of nem operon